MLKVLIADDEKIIRDGLKYVINWQENGFEIVYLASNGKEALDYCLENKPDIVITDIIMPVMNGLELISQLRSTYPEINILILTCHEEFSYAREAIKMGVDDYILKHSINYDELVKVLNKIKKKINKSQSIQEKTPVADGIKTGDILKRWVLGQHVPQEELVSCFETLKRNGFESGHMVLLKQQGISEISEDIEGITCKDMKTEVFYIDEQHTGMLCYTGKTHGKSLQKDISDLLWRIFNRNMEYNSGFLSAAVSNELNSPQNVKEAYQINLEILRCSFYKKSHTLLDPQDICAFRSETDIDAYGASDHYKNALLEGNLNKIEMLLEEAVNKYILKNILPEEVKKSSVQFMARSIEMVNARGLKLSDIYDVTTRPYQELLSAMNIYRIKEILFEFYRLTLERMNQNGNNSLKKEIRKVLEIVENSYWLDITLKDISKQVNVSYNYLVTMFRQEMGVSFADYLTNLRIKKAKQLLQDSQMKIYEISEKVGYKDPAYFCNLFKKMEQMTPLEYRQRL